MTIAIDFDGTIVEHRYPSIGKPKEMAFEALRALINDGHRLILWTSREGQELDEAVEFCRKNGVEFFAVNAEFPNDGWYTYGAAKKIKADIYIDDRNLRGLPDWSEIYSIISKKSLGIDLEDSDHHHHHSHHHHKKRPRRTIPFITALVDRCRNARDNFKI